MVTPSAVGRPRVRWSSSRPARFVVGLVLAGAVLAGCSSSPSAAQQVCSDRSQLNTAVSNLVGDLRSGNFSKAKDGLSAVSSAFDDLQQSVRQLASEQSGKLSPQIDDLQNTITGLKDATSIDQLLTGIGSARSQAQSISQQVGDSLNCS